MSRSKNIILLSGLLLAVGLISASFTAVLLTRYDSRIRFEMLESVCGGIIEEQPEASRTVFAVLKEYKNMPLEQSDGNILRDYGYAPSDFLRSGQMRAVLPIVGCAAGILLLLAALEYRRRLQCLRIGELTSYLEMVNTGSPGVLIQKGEDVFSGLQDEIYKTVTMLYQTREEAVKARERYAENLSNIAHQLKTPITSISLAAQLMKDTSSPENAGEITGQMAEQKAGQFAGQTAEQMAGQIKGQLTRLTYLEEALLLLSRIDAGTLTLERKPVDVFTVLTLAADNLSGIFQQARVTVDIPELGEAAFVGDMDWSMEAIINLLKNCMEHTKEGGCVHCSYEQNPLYTEIRIRDEGPGFAREDLPHLFERFYRGQNAGNGGIGLGLAFAKEIMEMQNGVISVGNLPGGGACFEIRLYSH